MTNKEILDTLKKIRRPSSLTARTCDTQRLVQDAIHAVNELQEYGGGGTPNFQPTESQTQKQINLAVQLLSDAAILEEQIEFLHGIPYIGIDRDELANLIYRVGGLNENQLEKLKGSSKAFEDLLDILTGPVPRLSNEQWKRIDHKIGVIKLCQNQVDNLDKQGFEYLSCIGHEVAHIALKRWLNYCNTEFNYADEPPYTSTGFSYSAQSNENDKS